MIKEDFLKDYTELISSGSTPKGGSDNYLDEGEILFIRSQNVLMNKFSNHDALYIPLNIHEKMKRTWVKKGDVLLNITGASLGRTTVYLGEDNKANVNQHVCIIRLKDFETINPFYLSYFLSSNSFQRHIVKINAGATRQALNFSQIGKFKIPIPPIETQKRIVEMIKKAEKLKEWRVEADELADEHLKSLFYEMFGNPFKNPFGFPSKKIKEVVDLINGRAFKPDEWEETGFKIIRIQNLNNPDSEYNYYSKEINPKFIVNNGDLLLSWSGTPGTSFGVFIWRGETAVLNQHIFNVKFKTESLNKYYFQFFINQKLIELISKSHGGVGLKHITKSKLNEVDIYIPPITLQNQFAQIVQQVETLKTHQTQSKQEIDNLFNTLMQKAFKGELVC